MKIFITGVNGQLGYDAAVVLTKRGHEVLGSGSRPENEVGAFLRIGGENAPRYVSADITDETSLRRAILDFMPDAVIHCAAYTAVDAAEKSENREKVYAVNTSGTAAVARACAEAGAKMLYISTDYVFGGEGEEPWQPDCRRFAPLNVYGDSKLRGEFAVAEALDQFFIVRTSWVFGSNGGNFVKTMLRLSETHDTLRVVNDQVGTPTYTPDLARLLADMAESDRYGYYHACNADGFISWYDFACEIFALAGRNTEVIPVSTAEYGLSAAKRPMNSRLGTGKLSRCGFEPLPPWRDALRRFLGSQNLLT